MKTWMRFALSGFGEGRRKDLQGVGGGVSVIELGRACQGMVRLLRGFFERAAVLQVSKRSHNRRFCGYTLSTRMPIEVRQRE